MNKITTTAGLVVLGAASFQNAVQAQMTAPGENKPWSISAVLRGFYDDNYTTSSSDLRRDSFGIEVSPSAALNLIRDQTALGLNYAYSMRYYEDREDDEIDHSHQFNAKLSHAFTPRYKLDITDSFVIAQEPEVLGVNSAGLTVPLRTEGDNMRNYLNTSFSAGVTETTDIVVGYGNTWYDYDESGLNSYSALLDRVEHLGSLQLRQMILENTIGVAGYQFQYVDYTSDSRYGNPFIPALQIPSEIRNSYAHIFTVGVDQVITSTLKASVRVGAQYTKYHDLEDVVDGIFPGVDLDLDDEQWNPYADANATWVYLPGSYAQLGVRHQRIQSDVGLVPTQTGLYIPNLDGEATAFYGSVSHRFFGALVASAIAQFQHTRYESGGADFDDNLILAGLNLTYEINKWIAAEAGYNYDRLDSDLDQGGIGRSFTRNRVYVGVRATY